MSRIEDRLGLNLTTRSGRQDAVDVISIAAPTYEDILRRVHVPDEDISKCVGKALILPDDPAAAGDKVSFYADTIPGIHKQVESARFLHPDARSAQIPLEPGQSVILDGK